MHFRCTVDFGTMKIFSVFVCLITCVSFLLLVTYFLFSCVYFLLLFTFLLRIAPFQAGCC